MVASERLERLRQPAEPGSLLKVATLVAAFSTGLVTPIPACPVPARRRCKGQIVRCSHPRLRHPLRPAEAVSVSCNVWFATIGERLSRARLDGVLTAMGLPPTPAGVPMPLVATGLRAAPSPPLAWVEALSRLLRRPSAVPLSAEARATLVEGLRGAALYGTSSAFSERGLDVLAKTGTATPAAGGTLGVVVAAWPPALPRVPSCWSHRVWPARTPPTWPRQVVANPPREAAERAPRRAKRGAPEPPGERRRAAPLPSEARPPSSRSDEPCRPPLAARSAEPQTVRVGSPRAGGGYTVEVLGVEDYVARVLAGEAAAGSPPAALEALAIAVRTFAAGNLARHRRDGFDLCTLTHCQVLRPTYPAVREAAAATSGQLLLVNGAPATVFHSASCGGRTERPSAVWPGADDPPYLPSKTDRACGGEPQWAAEIPVQDLERALVAAGYRGTRLRDLDVDGRSASGRVMRVGLKGMTPDAISGQDLRMVVGRTLGWHLLKSADFTVRQTSAGYRFDGKGFGHGVGLCVLGSVRRAEQGDSARDILRAYFPGLEIGRLPAAPDTAPARHLKHQST